MTSNVSSRQYQYASQVSKTEMFTRDACRREKKNGVRTYRFVNAVEANNKERLLQRKKERKKRVRGKKGCTSQVLQIWRGPPTYGFFFLALLVVELDP